MRATRKFFAVVSFLLTLTFIFTFILISSTAYAQVVYYGVSNVLQTDGTDNVELVLILEKSDEFSFDIIGRIENFSVSSAGGTVDCSVSQRGISRVNCNLKNITEAEKTLVFNYRTSDLVKALDNRFFFSADYRINSHIDRLVVKTALPEGAALVEEDGVPGRLTFAQNSTTASDGRRIIVTWELKDVPANEILKFEVLYESLTVPFWAELRIRYFLVFGIAVGAVLGFILLRRAKRTEKLVLSVLDDFERKVVDVIIANQGEVNQRKVVQETNLSKAKVSRVVQSLAERGVIKVERLGRTNKLKLLKEKLKI